ncbi:MAG: BamA/TamA family outer membrane protein, partial [Candidatus Latescibacterota bacterium]
MINIPLYKSTQHGFLGFDVDALIPLAGHTLGLELAAYKTLHSEDFWQVSRTENALLLVLSANEYANYYEKRGGSAGFIWRPGMYVTVGVTGMLQRDVSMKTQDKVFTILGSKGNLAPNPPIDQGERLAGRVTVQFDTREDRVFPGNAWLFGVAIETGRLSPDEDDAVDIDYTAFTIEANRYTLFPFGLQWDIGTRLSSSFDAIPFQLFQTLNGYGGLRGTNRVPFDVPRGDRMVRLSTEFRYPLPDIPVMRFIYSRWDILGFADAGLLTEADNPTSPFGWLDTPFSYWKKTVGLGVSGESFFPYVGFYVAQEIDGDRTSPR